MATGLVGGTKHGTNATSYTGSGGTRLISSKRHEHVTFGEKDQRPASRADTRLVPIDGLLEG